MGQVQMITECSLPDELLEFGWLVNPCSDRNTSDRLALPVMTTACETGQVGIWF